MKYSKLFGKTIREAPSDAVLESHKLLYRGGFIRDLSAGRYLLTPLGYRVFEKIIQIVDGEMKEIGGQRVGTPTLHPLELWQVTHRDEAFGEGLMRVKDRRGAWFAIGATAEAVMTDFAKKFKPSWRDLPFILYQFSQKFRDELRARGGLMRVREFLMKDSYSFCADKESLMKIYWDHFHAYERILSKLKIKAIPVLAESGALGGDFCHEFIVPFEGGEDTILTCSCGYAANKEKAEFVREEINLNEGEKPMEVVEQPEWVETMEDNIKHYGLPKSRYLKNVVYKTPKGKIIIAVIRGDLDISEAKLTRVANEGELTPASDDDLLKMGTKSGWVHSWGHEGARYLGDISLQTVKNFIGGQKEKTTDTINVNYGRDFKVEILADIAEAKSGSLCIKCNKKLEEVNGVEFGHVFKYDDFYSKAMEATFTDKDGKEKPLLMGAYGIGVERAMAIVVELHHDGKGIVWPKEVAPYQVHLIELKSQISKVKDETQKSKGEEIYNELIKAGIEVLFDEREEVSAGVKFSDADLIGIPVRLVVSDKTLRPPAGGSGQAGDKIEYKERNSTKLELLSLEEVINKIVF